MRAINSRKPITEIKRSDGSVLITSHKEPRYALQDLAAQRGAIFRNLHLGGVKTGNMTGISLHGVTFEDCELGGVNFSRSQLIGARFINCYLAQAIFQKATLYGATISHCNLFEVDFSGCNLRHATIENCDLISATAEGALFKETVISQTSVDFDWDYPGVRFKE